jgi:hypothetical protein
MGYAKVLTHTTGSYEGTRLTQRLTEACILIAIFGSEKRNKFPNTVLASRADLDQRTAYRICVLRRNAYLEVDHYKRLADTPYELYDEPQHLLDQPAH